MHIKGASSDADVLTCAGASTDEIIDTPHKHTKNQTKTHIDPFCFKVKSFFHIIDLFLDKKNVLTIWCVLSANNYGLVIHLPVVVIEI